MKFNLEQANKILRIFGHAQCPEIVENDTTYDYVEKSISLIFHLSRSKDINDRLAQNYVRLGADFFDTRIEIGSKGLYFTPYDDRFFSLKIENENQNNSDSIYQKIKQFSMSDNIFSKRSYSLLLREIQTLWEDVGMEGECPQLRKNYSCPGEFHESHDWDSRKCWICGKRV